MEGRADDLPDVVWSSAVTRVSGNFKLTGTYDLRRLRHHGLLERIPHSHRYRVTDTGLSTAMFISAVHDRLLPTGLADLETPVPTRLRAATRAYQTAIDHLTHITGLAA